MDLRNIRKSFRDQGFGHNSSFCKHTKGIWPPEKCRQFGSKEYQYHFSNKRFRYYQPLLVYKSHMTPRKKYFMCTEGISEQHFKMKDLGITNYSAYIGNVTP